MAFTTDDFDSADRDTWQRLWQRQQPNLDGEASTLFEQGMEVLDLPQDHPPSLRELDKQIEDWTLVVAEERYLSDVKWFKHLAKREWPVSDFLRDGENIDFTPLPDLFHDVFGHLAFLVHEEFNDLADRFAHAFLEAQGAQRKRIARAWWHSIEFGFVKEAGEKRALGAGLISSKKELDHARETKHVPYSWERAASTPKSSDDVHPQHFVVESFDRINEALTEGFP